jgi:hypothetical protein
MPGKDDSFLLQAPKTAGEDVGSDPGDRFGQLTKPAGTGLKTVDHQQGPAITNPGQGRMQGVNRHDLMV